MILKTDYGPFDVFVDACTKIINLKLLRHNTYDKVICRRPTYLNQHTQYDCFTILTKYQYW